MHFSVDELRSLALLEGLGERPLAWLAEHGARLELDAGQHMFERGQPAEFMFVVVKGVIQRYEEVGGQWLVVATTRRGQVTGMLPYSRMTHYPGHTVAMEPSTLLRVNASEFDEMLHTSHALGQRLVAEMSNRVRGDVRLEQHREKMMALGRLSAGLAHELNNPTAAIRRTADGLSGQLERQSARALALARANLDERTLDAIGQLECAARDREPARLSPLARSEREERIHGWLEAHAVADGWETASVLTDTALLVEELDRFAAGVPGDVLPDALAWVACRIRLGQMAAEISACAGRVADLVSSVKAYSDMDRSTEHRPTDVREGLDSTLTMFCHRLGQKNIEVATAYAEALPAVSGNAGELNQIWTILIDNAVDAMSDGGRLRIEVGHDEWFVGVGIIDDGVGIPDQIRPRIFEPFFTTKDVGEGTGLGLDIARRIVGTHRGQIEVRSGPGRTEMLVRLPIARGEGLR